MSDDRTGEGSIENRKGSGVPGAGVTGNMNRERWAVATQWQSGSGLCRTEGLGGGQRRLPALVLCSCQGTGVLSSGKNLDSDWQEEGVHPDGLVREAPLIEQ